MSYEPRTGGHAPGYLCEAFLELVGNYMRAAPGEAIDPPTLDEEPIEPAALCDQLWNCPDIMPRIEAEAIDLPAGTTYAQAVRHLKPLLA